MVSKITAVEFAIIAEPYAGMTAEQLLRDPVRSEQIERVVAAPFAGYQDVLLHPTVGEQAAVYAARTVAYHPLIDGNKRTAWAVMQEYLARNGVMWLGTGARSDATPVIQLAAGEIDEDQFIRWVMGRTR